VTGKTDTAKLKKKKKLTKEQRQSMTDAINAASRAKEGFVGIYEAQVSYHLSMSRSLAHAPPQDARVRSRRHMHAHLVSQSMAICLSLPLKKNNHFILRFFTSLIDLTMTVCRLRVHHQHGRCCCG